MKCECGWKYNSFLLPKPCPKCNRPIKGITFSKTEYAKYVELVEKVGEEKAREEWMKDKQGDGE